MKSIYALAVVFLSLGWSSAFAAPDCWGVTALNAANKKVLRITCSNPNTPGTAPSYSCSFTWKVRTVDGVVHTVQANFTSVRGESNVLKYDEFRVQGKDIDDEVEGILVSCGAT
jgi:hypothetical protein